MHCKVGVCWKHYSFDLLILQRSEKTIDIVSLKQVLTGMEYYHQLHSDSSSLLVIFLVELDCIGLLTLLLTIGNVRSRCLHSDSQIWLAFRRHIPTRITNNISYNTIHISLNEIFFLVPEWKRYSMEFKKIKVMDRAAAWCLVSITWSMSLRNSSWWWRQKPTEKYQKHGRERKEHLT